MKGSPETCDADVMQYQRMYVVSFACIFSEEDLLTHHLHADVVAFFDFPPTCFFVVYVTLMSVGLESLVSFGCHWRYKEWYRQSVMPASSSK